MQWNPKMCRLQTIAENLPLDLKLYDIGALPTPVTNFFKVGSQCTLRTEDFTSSEPLRMCTDTN
jgi:hypothetical protein